MRRKLEDKMRKDAVKTAKIEDVEAEFEKRY